MIETTLNLDVPKVVLITRENFIKILRVIKQNKKEVAINDDKGPSNSSTEIVIQESAQNSSFDVKADSTFLLINNQNSNDSGNPISIPSSLKEKKKLIQHADSLLDEYSNFDEENDEQKFDAALTLLHKAMHSSLQSINKALNQLLVTNNVQENTKRMEYSLSESSDADLNASGGLQSSNKIVNFSQTSNDPEFDPDVGEANVSKIAERNKNEMLAISSIIDNQQKLSTSLLNINEQNQSDKLMDFQAEDNDTQPDSDLDEQPDSNLDDEIDEQK
ncbi:1540_t:CDS:10, partial [Cetraspora pellucida]